MNKFISAPDTTLDLVYTYVDTTDPIWLKKVRKYKPDYGKTNLNKQRFNYNNEIQFSLRTVQKFAPWFRNIFIVSDNQTFELDFLEEKIRNKIKFINHTDIIPLKYLPVFNSSLIEMFLNNIEGLSDYFIFLNDDVFFGNYITPSYFFDKNRVLKSFMWDRKREIDKNKRISYALTIYKSHKLIYEKFKVKKYYKSNHVSWNLNKNMYKITFNLFKDKFIKMLETQKFRTYNKDSYDFTTLLCIVSNIYGISKIFDIRNIFVKHSPLTNNDVSNIFRRKPSMFCLNSLNISQKKQWDNIQNNYLKLFNNNNYEKILNESKKLNISDNIKLSFNILKKAKTIYLINGLRRSGNHLFIGYLISGLKKKVYFLNNLKNSTLLNDKFDYNIMDSYLFDNNIHKKILNIHNFEKKINKNNTLIISVEDKDIKKYNNFKNKLKTKTNKIIEIVVIRDILNNFASRIKKGMNEDLNLYIIDKITIKYWNELYNKCKDKNIICFNYNKFIYNKDNYKDKLNKKLKLINPKEIVSLAAKGSSFNPGNKKKQNLKDYFTRFLLYTDNEIIQKILNDEKILKILKKDFLLDVSKTKIKYCNKILKFY